MQDITGLLFAVAAIAVSIVASRWWYGRELRRLEQKIGRVNADRDVLHEQVKKAREQVGQLQKELSARRQQPAPAPAKPAVRTEAPAMPGAAAAALAGGLLFEAPQLAAHGFADTQPFSESTFPGLRRRP